MGKCRVLDKSERFCKNIFAFTCMGIKDALYLHYQLTAGHPAQTQTTMQKVTFKNGWASHQRMYPQGWGVIEGRKATQAQAQKWAAKLGATFEQPEQVFEPYFYGFQDHDDFVTVKVEIETIEKLLYCEVSIKKDDLMNGMDNARMFDLRLDGTIASTEDRNGNMVTFDCIAWASLDPNKVFQAIHKVEPFKFTNLKTNPL